MSRIFLFLCISVLLAAGFGSAFAGDFDLEEIQVTPSPDQVRFLPFKQVEKVVDFDVAKDGPRVAILIQNQTGDFKVAFWNRSF